MTNTWSLICAGGASTEILVDLTEFSALKVERENIVENEYRKSLLAGFLNSLVRTVL